MKAIKYSAYLLYVFMYLPLAVVIAYSFNNSKYGTAWKGFTLKWYESLINNEQALQAATNSLIIALSSTFFSTILGTLLGYGLSRYWFPAKKAASTIMYIPIVIPDILMAIALVIFYGLMREWLGIFELGMTSMIVAHITFQIAFVALIVKARMAGIDPALEEAAIDLGASRRQVFLKITLPLMLPGIIAAALLAFTLSLDDFVVSFFTSGPGSTTMPIMIYSSVKRGISPEINALSSLIMLVSACLVSIFSLIQLRKCSSKFD